METLHALAARVKTRTGKDRVTLGEVLAEWVLCAVEHNRRERITQAREDHPELTAHLADEDVLRWLKLGHRHHP